MVNCLLFRVVLSVIFQLRARESNYFPPLHSLYHTLPVTACHTHYPLHPLLPHMSLTALCGRAPCAQRGYQLGGEECSSCWCVVEEECGSASSSRHWHILCV